MKKVLFFISDHGFGHAARSCTIINYLLEAGFEVFMVTSVPLSFMQESIHNFDAQKVINMKTDIGLLQSDSVTINIEETLIQLKQFVSSLKDKTNQLIHTFTEKKWIPDVIISDVTILGTYFREALVEYLAKENISAIPIKSILISNFTWVEIYSPFVTEHPEFNEYVHFFKSVYNKADKFFCYPLCTNVAECGIDEDKIVEIGCVSRVAKTDKSIVRNWLDQLQPSEDGSELQYLLYSFGGFTAPFEKVFKEWNSPPSNWRVIWIDRSSDTKEPATKKGIIILNHSILEASSLEYIDLLSSVDAVLIKTGFGVVSECLRYNLRVLFVDRPGFIEHKYLAEALKENLSAMEVPIEKAIACDIFDILGRLSTKQNSKIAFNGGETVVQLLADL